MFSPTCEKVSNTKECASGVTAKMYIKMILPRYSLAYVTRSQTIPAVWFVIETWFVNTVCHTQITVKLHPGHSLAMNYVR